MLCISSYVSKEKRQQLLNEMRTLCDACCYQGLVEFHGAFYTPDTGQVSIVLEYMDGGSLADVLRLQRSIPEHILSRMLPRLLGVRAFSLLASQTSLIWPWIFWF